MKGKVVVLLLLIMFLYAASGAYLQAVKFIVQDVNGVRYQDVNVTAYDGATQVANGLTGLDGAVTFNLSKDVGYRFTFINATLGINREATLYPIDTEYTIYANTITGSTFEEFSYNITKDDSNNITLCWVDNGILNSLNFTILNGSKAVVHQEITSNTSGQSTYTVTDTSDIYYVYFTADTTQGIISYSTTFDYRLGTKTGKDVWGYGSFIVPDWVQNILAVILLLILAGSFGALHSGLGSIITGIFALFFWSKGWLDTLGAGAAFFGGLVVIVVIYYLRKHQAVRG